MKGTSQAIDDPAVRSDSAAMRLRRVGFLIPEFPQQTHIAWWRVSQGMISAGVEVHLLSTRRPNQPCPHPCLVEAARETTYLWPPSPSDLKSVPALLRHLRAASRYVIGLKAVRGLQRLRALAFVVSAMRLLRLAKAWRLDHVFMHSCGDAAHVGALCQLLGGPGYSLRLGGDLEVYGTDHRSKMVGATLIVTAAPAHEARLEHEIGVPRARIMWSWVGTDTDLFRPRRDAPPGEGPLRIVTVARLNRAKGFQFMLPALAELHLRGVSVDYRIVGEGSFREDIERMIAELKLEGRVRLLGSLSSERIAEILRDSDLFVLPTSGIGEGTPAAVCEAMSSGLPIIATRVGGLQDMVDEDVHGMLVPPGDATALAAAVEASARSPSIRIRMGVASRDRAVREFDARTVAQRILQRICELATKSGGGCDRRSSVESPSQSDATMTSHSLDEIC